MTKQYFISLFEYDKWANLKIAEALKPNASLPVKCKTLFHHIGATLDMWYSRVNNTNRLFQNLFDKSNPEITTSLLIEADERWLKFLTMDEVDLQSFVKYKNTKGKEFENNLIDILTQLITHNHYHRGQINQLLRQAGFEPAKTDYIFYVRD